MTAGLLAVLMLLGAPPKEAQLLMPGQFHGDEVKAASGEVWLGLVPVGSGYAWQLRRLTVESVHDGIVDDEGQKTGLAVGAGSPEPLFLLKGMDFLAASVVRRATGGEGEELDSGSPLRLHQGKRAYSIRTTHARVQENSDQPTELVLESEGKRQVLGRWESGLVDQHCELVWAGDLDGDGRLDLFLDVSDHYNVWRRVLYLSSKAGEGQLVREVAAFERVGC